MKTPPQKSFIERSIGAIGSVPSVIAHTVLFASLTVLTVANVFPRDLVLLVWNTMVSLEAIYLALFIQISVNRNTAQLREVGEDIDEIQEDVEDIQEDVEELGEDIDEIQEDIDEIQEDVEELSEEDKALEAKETGTLSEKEILMRLAEDMSRMASILDQLKGKE